MYKNKSIPNNVQVSIITILNANGFTVDDFISQQIQNKKQESGKDFEPWITRKEAAAIARVSTDTIDKWRETGCIKSAKTNKARCGHVAIDRESLEFFLRSKLTSSSNEKEAANV